MARANDGVAEGRITPNRHGRRRAANLRIDISRPLSEQPAYLTFADVAALLGKSVRTIASWEQKKLVRASRPCNGTPVICRSEVERILREGGAQ